MAQKYSSDLYIRIGEGGLLLYDSSLFCVYSLFG